MRRIIGITMLAISILAGIVLDRMGALGTALVTREFSASGVHVTDVNYVPNWWVVVPLIVCFLVGLACVVLPHRHRPRG